MKVLYENWAKIGGVAAVIIIAILLIVPIPGLEIGSYEWLFWLVIPFYFIHQFEEYVYPGNFKATINEVLSRQNEIDFPLNDKNSFYINTILGTWLLVPIIILLGSFSIWFPLIIVSFSIFNAILHIGGCIKFKQYKPGLVASVFLNLPLGIYILSGVVLDGIVPVLHLPVILFLGLVFHWVILLPLILNFIRNRNSFQQNNS